MKTFIKVSAIFLLLVIPTLAYAQDCHQYDINQDWVIEDFELLDSIDDWAAGNLGDFPLLDLIDLWADICYHWDASAGKYKVGNLCGDSFLQPGEDCDGGGVDTAACDADCSTPACGDNHTNTAAGEQCDDGNTMPGDSCSADCKLLSCGNGTVDAGEGCDDGNTTGGDGCSVVCQIEECGNSITDPGEDCDGGGIDTAGCDADCTVPACGDGHINIAEGEQCDDGNTTAGDGCSADCKLPSCGDGTVDAGEGCDDGNTTGGDGCSVVCQPEVCGNGILDIGEDCDKGGVDTAGCDADCSNVTCSDGYRNALAGEECDDGNTTPGDGCDADCINEATNNLTLTSVKVLDIDEDGNYFPITKPTLYVGHPVMIQVGITAVEDTEDVSVQFYIVDKVKFDNAGDVDPECVSECNADPDCVCVEPDCSDQCPYVVNDQFVIGGFSPEEDDPECVIECKDDPDCVCVEPDCSDQCPIVVKVKAGDNVYIVEIPIPYTDNDINIEIDADCVSKCNSNPDCVCELSDCSDQCLDADPVHDGVSIPSGQFYLYAEVDPANTIPETNEDDNRPQPGINTGQAILNSADTASLTGSGLDETMIISEVSDLEKDTPNIILEDVTVGIRAFELFKQDNEEDSFCPDESRPGSTGDVQNADNSHLSLTAVINSSGLAMRSDIHTRVDVHPTLRWTGPDGTEREISIMTWTIDPGSNAVVYKDKLSVYDLEPGVPTSVHVDLRLPLDDPAVLGIGAHLVTEAVKCLVNDCNPDPVCLSEFAHVVSGCASCLDVDDLTCLNSKQCVTLSYSCGLCAFDANPFDCLKSKSCIDLQCAFEECVDSSCLATCADRDSLSQCADDTCVAGCGQKLLDEGIGLIDVKVTAYKAAIGIKWCSTWGIKWPCGSQQIWTDIEEFEPPGFELSNELAVEIVMLDPWKPAPHQGALEFGKDYNKKFDGKFASLSLNAAAKAGLSGEGAYANLDATVPVKLFGMSQEILGLDMRANAFPSRIDKNYFNLDLKFLGKPIYPVNVIPEILACTAGNAQSMLIWRLGGEWETCVTNCPVTPDMPDPTDPPYVWTEYHNDVNARDDCLLGCGAFGKSIKNTGDVPLFGIPFTATFEAFGLIGFVAEAEIPVCKDPDDPDAGKAFIAKVGPWLDIGMDASAGIGHSEVISAGIGGVAHLVKDTFFATAQVLELSYDESYINGIVTEDITNTLDGPHGRLYGYVGYPCLKWCKKWGVPYICGTKQCKEKKTFYEFSSYHREDVLFCDEQPVSVLAF